MRLNRFLMPQIPWIEIPAPLAPCGLCKYLEADYDFAAREIARNAFLKQSQFSSSTALFYNNYLRNILYLHSRQRRTLNLGRTERAFCVANVVLLLLLRV